MASLSVKVYIVNNTGPRTDPCGTSYSKADGTETTPSMTTLWVRSARYDLNQLRTIPEQPNVVVNLSMRISWSIVSNAADKARIETSPESDAIQCPENSLLLY